MHVSKLRDIKYKKLYISISFLSLSLSLSLSAANTIFVGPHYSYETILDGIDHAQDGDTIALEAGHTFYGSGNEGLRFESGYINKSLHITSVDSTRPATVWQIPSADFFCQVNDFQLSVTIDSIKFENSSHFIIKELAGNVVVANCSFKNDESVTADIYVQGGAASISDCYFEDNDAITMIGGVVNVSCCRLNSQGLQLAVGDGTCIATNNWWGSNANPRLSGKISYNGGDLTYDPWIVMTTQLTAPTPFPGELVTVQTDFLHDNHGDSVPCSSSSIFNGIPVNFSALGGSVSPTHALTTNGVASANFLPSNVHYQVCSTADNGTSCTNPILSPTGAYRLNWGCNCTENGTEHILFGSYNSASENSLKGWRVNLPLSCLPISNPLILTPHVIYNVAVYNKQDTVYIAMITAGAITGPYNLKLTSYKNSAFTPNPPNMYQLVTPDNLPQPSPTYKVQWIPHDNTSAYVAVDSHDSIRLYPVNLSSMTVGTPLTTPNLGTGYASSFLYWLSTSNYLYLVQGFNFTRVATYRVNLATPSIEPGVLSTINSDFDYFNTCATCSNYFVIGGKKGTEGVLISYGIDALSGKLKEPVKHTLPSPVTTVYYTERCCCSPADYFLVGTDRGLYAYDSLSLENPIDDYGLGRKWLNVAWCCGAHPVLCSAVSNVRGIFVFKEENGTILSPACNPVQ